LRQLRYPDYEVIVVDDGSTDATKSIAERYPEFRLISHENRGLSVARNEGCEAATGEVVAYTDSDCAAHPDWLGFLTLRLLSGDFVGVGGPNLPPPEDDWVPEAVARSPGGPTHVLLTDEVAEHIPGCNMAFWRDSLNAVGGFDPTFHAAGDDIDICWRLQDRGGRIGYAPSALVWHRRRSTVAAYLKQQRGYGDAEAALYFKHPYRFNELGQSRWLGRIYADLGRGLLSERPRVHSGQFGSALFQTLYQPASSLVSHMPVTLEWNAAALGLIAAGPISAVLFDVWHPMLTIGGLLMIGVSVGQACSTALNVDVEGLPRWRARALIAALTYLGPFLRAVERHKSRIAGAGELPTTERGSSSHAAYLEPLYRRFSLAYWNDSSVEKHECLSVLIDYFKIRKFPVVLDDGWQGWDLSVLSGAWIRGEINVLVENHGGEQRQVDVGVRLRHNTPAKLIYGVGAAITAIGIASASVATVITGVAATLATAGVFAHRVWRLGGLLHHAIGDAFREAPLIPLPRDGTPDHRSG
jgi:glycosyltransferase involved in cell wall biosynthesis